jgi:hypothetical protein
MSCHPQRRLSTPGDLSAACLTFAVFIFLAAIILTGVLETEMPGLAQSGLVRPQRERGVSQKQPIKSAASASTPTTERMGDHYLMLVNTAMANQMDARKLAQFDRSPYDGLAVSFAGAYDPAPVLTLPPMQARVASWKKATRKDIWPWVYLNRMIGANDAEGNPLTKVPSFQRFQGLDLDGKAGAQNDFLENWRNALRLAKQTGVPGIVCDLEFYNNYKAYDLAELARMTSKPRPDVLIALRQLGARMADIAAAEYSGATLWFFFTGFTRPDYRVIDGQPYYLAATYIAEGLFDQIQQHHLPLRVLSGGEVGLGYCHTSVDDLRQAISKRADAFALLLQKYRGILELAGTMTLWSDQSGKKNWVAQAECGTSSAATVEDLIPYMELLFGTYRYNWIYASPNGGYFAFQSTSAPRFDAAITQAKARAFDASSGRPGL